MNLYKVTVKTPKNQAKKCIKSQKDHIVGYTGWSTVIEEKVTAHNEFYYIVKLKNKKNLHDLVTRAAKAEVLIRKFYSMLFNVINRANKIGKKFNRGYTWIKKWMISRFKKQTQSNKGIVEELKNMSNEEFADFLVIDDKEEMNKLLNNDIIKITKYKKKENDVSKI